MLELKNISASQINEFITNRSMWFAKKFRGLKTPMNLPMARGRAVEAGINYFVSNDKSDITAAVKAAMDEYDKASSGLVDDLTFRQSIGPTTTKMISHFNSICETLKSKPRIQEKIEIYLDGCSIPLTGYLDYIWDARCVRDCKVTGKTPSELTDAYKIQGAIYRHVTKLPVVFTFGICKKEFDIKEIKLSEDDFMWGLKIATKAAQAIEKIVSTPIDGELIEAFLFPNTDAGYSKEDVNLILKEYGVLD